MKHHTICPLILLAIITMVEIVESVCIPRAFNGPKRLTDLQEFNKRTEACVGTVKKLKQLSAHQCAALPECLWISSDGYIFEGETIASTKYIKTKLLKGNERKDVMYQKSHINDATKKTLKDETNDAYKKDLKILTIDSDSVMYELSFTDFDAHHKAALASVEETDPVAQYLEKLETERSQNKEQTPKKHSPQEADEIAKKLKLMLHHHGEAEPNGYSFRRLLQAQNTSERADIEVQKFSNETSRSRRLLWTNAANVNNAPFRGMALIRSTDESMGITATAIVIHKSRRHSRGPRRNREHYYFVYVIAAAHDLVSTHDGTTLAAEAADWRLYPKYHNLAPEASWGPLEGQGLRLQRAWILQGYTDAIAQNQRTGQQAMQDALQQNPNLQQDALHAIAYQAMNDGLQNGADIAILKFEAAAHGNNDKWNYPVHNPRNGANQAICTYSVQGVNGPMILREEDNVDVTCAGSLCQYTGHELAPGNCGGAVYEGNNNADIFAMHVAISPGNTCSGNPDWTACIGYAVKMTAGRRKAIKSIIAWNTAWGRNIEAFRELFTAREDYQNIYPYEENDEEQGQVPIWDNRVLRKNGDLGYYSGEQIGIMLFVIAAFLIVCVKGGCFSMLAGFLICFNFEVKDIPFVNINDKN